LVKVARAEAGRTRIAAPVTTHRACLAALIALATACVSSSPSPQLALPATSTPESAQTPTPAEPVADVPPDAPSSAAEDGDVAGRPEEAPEAPKAPFKFPVVPREQTGIVVLTYHYFMPPPMKYSITPKRFEEHLAWMSEHMDVISMQQLVAFLDGELELPQRAAVITIDDGHRSTYTKAFPLLKKYETKFTIAIITAAQDKWKQKISLTWEMVQEMVDSGLCEVASHSARHPDLIKIGPHPLKYELTHSAKSIEENVGTFPLAMVYPLGSHDGRVRDYTKAAGYSVGFGIATIPWKYVTAKSRRYALPRQGADQWMTVPRLRKAFGIGKGVPESRRADRS
jgi:peptidoglycan/xylan/chitin deacetylase (PgdA/CDA1 family)